MPKANAEATMTKFMLPSYLTVDRLRIPEAATVPNSTMPAPPKIGMGIAATTWPSHGTSPSATMITPPAVTTQRDLIPDNATRHTLWANADWVKDPKNGAAAVANMSDRSPTSMLLVLCR